MGRWEPGAADRLRDAAVDLFQSRGFDATTVAEIAAAAGVTERTFFRHYADKREVLFDGQQALRGIFAAGIRDAPHDESPLAVAGIALDLVGEIFSAERREWSVLRRRIIESHASLGEREQFKMLSLGAAVAGAYRERGLCEPGATLAAQTAMALFQVAFQMWTTSGEQRGYAELVDVALAELRRITVA